MEVKQFISLHLFELCYLALLAILPFIVRQPAVGLTLIVLGILVGFRSLYRQFTYQTVDLVNKRILITGCDSGFGNALARRLASRGATVYAGCLFPDGEGASVLRSETDGVIHVVSLDVRSDKSVEDVYTKIKGEDPGHGLWCVVNNAAINFMGDVEFCTMEMYRRIAEVNMFGVVSVTKRFIGMVRKEKGRIVNVTSTRGLMPNPSTTCYGMTKYAVETFSDILRLEMRKFNVKVVIVEPGNFGGATNMLSKNTLAGLKRDFDTMWTEADEDTRRTYGRAYLDSQYQSVVDSAATAAKTILPVVDAMEAAVSAVNPQYRYLVDGSNSLIDYNNLIARIKPYLPETWIDWLIDREYNSGVTLPETDASSKRTQ